MSVSRKLLLISAHSFCMTARSSAAVLQLLIFLIKSRNLIGVADVTFENMLLNFLVWLGQCHVTKEWKK